MTDILPPTLAKVPPPVSGQTCLVTGCAGFVGSHLCEAMIEAGNHVVGVDNLSSGKEANMHGFIAHENFAFHNTDITEPGLLKRLKEEHPDLSRIVHLAGVVSVEYSIDHEEHTLRTNYDTSVSLYDQCREMGFKSFVFAGSAAEYGDIDQLPLHEDSVREKEAAQGAEGLQSSPYGRAKYMTTRHIETNGFGSSLRFFNIYGPRQGGDNGYAGVITCFFEQLLRGGPLVIHGDGQQKRDFIHVSDAVHYLMAASGLLTGIPPLVGVYNVGTQRGVTILELARLVAGAMDIHDPQIDFLPVRQGDIKESYANTEKVRQALGLTPQVRLEDGLRDYSQHLKDKTS